MLLTGTSPTETAPKLCSQQEHSELEEPMKAAEPGHEGQWVIAVPSAHAPHLSLAPSCPSPSPTRSAHRRTYNTELLDTAVQTQHSSAPLRLAALLCR